MRLKFSIVVANCAFVALTGCQRERRVFDPGAADSQAAAATPVSEVHAGQVAAPQPEYNPYEQSAYAVGEGKRLFEAYNCQGCHQHGGGGIGPALMDSKWIYGSRSQQIYDTIVQGRPNGMPSFAGKIPTYQVWELAAYVRSMSGLLPSDVAPSRSDQMPAAKAEQARPKANPEDESQQPAVKGPAQ